MNNEIKEILNYFIKYMTIDDCIRLNKVEDYITNLQQENQRLLKKSYKDDVTITKAIELIKRSAGYKGICTQPETDTFSLLLEILGGKENE